MSVHRSLALKGGGKGHRNVLSREERIAKLADEGRWTEEQSIFGLPKVRSIKPKAGKRAAKKKAAAEEAPAAAEEAAPAEGEATEGPRKAGPRADSGKGTSGKGEKK